MKNDKSIGGYQPTEDNLGLPPMGEQKLHCKAFDLSEEITEWANGEDGTDYIVSIVNVKGTWFIFYIK